MISTTLRVPNDTVISVPKTDTNIKLKMIIAKERGRANEIWSTIIPTTKTSPKLAMTQTLQQSIQMLHYNTEDLFKFLESKALENPLFRC